MSKILSIVPGVVAVNVCAINKDKMLKSAKQVLTKQESVNKEQDELPKVRSCNAALTNVQCSD